MIVLYGLKTCDTCRKALRSLRNSGFEVTYVDVRTDGISENTMAIFYEEFGFNLVNTRSTTWRGLSEEQRKEPALSLLAAHPTLMKRPVIDHNGALTLGWGKAVVDRFLP